jgi:hypothetical protein
MLTAGGLAGLLTQVPAGEFLDIVRSKRVLVGAAPGETAIEKGRGRRSESDLSVSDFRRGGMRAFAHGGK